MKRFNLTSVFNNRGFTLIEILIAITILAFMTMGVVSITQNAADTMERTTVLNKNNLQIETALSRFEWDFTQIYSPLYFSSLMNLAGNANDADSDGRDDNTGKQITQATPSSPALQEYYQRLIQRFDQNQHFKAVSREGLPVPVFYSPDKTIFEFFTSSNRRKMENTKQSHFGWVRYSLGDAIKRSKDEEDDKSELIPPGLRPLVRYYNADDPYDDKRIDPEDAEHVKAAVLLENVESLEFQFWNMTSRKWETNLKSAPGAENTIRGIKLLITWYDSTGYKRSVSRIYRNHWPMEVPQDNVVAAPPTTAGAGGTTGGTAGASSDDSGIDDGTASAGGSN